jgi:hypothetical protein
MHIILLVIGAIINVPADHVRVIRMYVSQSPVDLSTMEWYFVWIRRADRMTRHSYSVGIEPGYVAILCKKDAYHAVKDLISIVRNLGADGINLTARPVICRSPSGGWDGVWIVGGEFNGLIRIHASTPEEARQAMISVADGHWYYIVNSGGLVFDRYPTLDYTNRVAAQLAARFPSDDVRVWDVHRTLPLDSDFEPQDGDLLVAIHRTPEGVGAA